MEERKHLKLSKSSKADYMTCQRKFWHSRIAKTDVDLDFKKGKALSFGAAFAECLEICRQDMNKVDYKFVFGIARKHGVGLNDIAKVMACLYEYMKHIPFFEQVENVEAWLEHPIFTGKIDKIIIRDGKRYIGEDKTSSDINESVLRTQLITDPQLCLYASRAHQFGAEGIIYRVVEKPKERRKKEESFDDYLNRCQCKFLELFFPLDEFEIGTAIADFETVRDEILSKKEEKEFLCNKNNCIQYYSPCAWYSRCHGKPYTIANGEW